MRVVALLAVLSAGCSLYFDEPPHPEMTPAERDWVNLAYPVFERSCTACHAGSQAGGGINFLAGDDALAVRATILGFQPPVVNLDSPASSRVLVKGLHSGPALDAQDASDLLTWVQAEREEAGVTAELETPQFHPLMCVAPGNPSTCPGNVLALDGLAMPGSTLRFVAQPQDGSLVVSQLEFQPAAGSTATLFHPRFVAHVGIVDVADEQLANLVVSQPGAFGPAQLVLSADFANNPISFRVETP